MKTGYKVVRKINDTEYGPATLYAYQGIRYSLGQPTVQEVDGFGPMSVFDCLLLAQTFAINLSHLPGLVVFKVQYIYHLMKKGCGKQQVKKY